MDNIDRLIDNAYRAMDAAQDQWFKDYWQLVANTLMRRYNRCQ